MKKALNYKEFLVATGTPKNVVKLSINRVQSSHYRVETVVRKMQTHALNKGFLFSNSSMCTFSLKAALFIIHNTWLHCMLSHHQHMQEWRNIYCDDNNKKNNPKVYPKLVQNSVNVLIGESVLNWTGFTWQVLRVQYWITTLWAAKKKR